MTYDDLMRAFSEMKARNRSFCDYDVDYRFDRNSANGAASRSVLHPIGSAICPPDLSITIGMGSVMAHKLPDGRVRDDDGVRAVFQMFHESAHLWQYTVAYMQSADKASEYIKDMARDDAISICFPTYQRAAYPLSTAEIFANRYGAAETKAFFERAAESDSRLRRVPVDSTIIEHIRYGRERMWPELMECYTINDFCDVHDKMMLEAPYRKKFIVPQLLDRHTSDRHLARLLNDRYTMDMIMSADNGKTEAGIICNYIGRHYPDYFRSLLCIKDEYVGRDLLGISERAASRLLRVSPQPWRDIPAHKPDSDDFEME